MKARIVIRPNSYYDSVSLMAISQQVVDIPGVQAAVVAMATDMNKELLEHVGLLTPEADAAGPSDLVIAVGASDQATAEEAAVQAEAMLRQRAAAPKAGGWGVAAPRTLRAALKADPEANLALISVPGAYAAREAAIALDLGLHVMLYSDNVPVAAEIDLKRRAHEKGLLLMGPDCGTAIIGGVGLGFANAVRRGPIGIVAASGTGAQELSTLIDRFGSGVSHLLGVGGRDLSAQVGGIMMMDGIRMLQEDPETEVIVLISKPPAPEVASRLEQELRSLTKPHVTCFLSGKGAISIDEAAAQAVALATGRQVETDKSQRPLFEPGPGRRYVRGIFSGGTLCDQALMILEGALGPVSCNVHADPTRRSGAAKSFGHTLVDLGDDEFTRGRPHPMIDMTLRRMRILEEAKDPEVAAILLDIVIGYGTHPDPVGGLADAISMAVRQGIAVVASVTGTESDPQRSSHQIEALRRAGAKVGLTAREAAEAVAASLKGR